MNAPGREHFFVELIPDWHSVYGIETVFVNLKIASYER